jgi:pimeloyl-ACP methyl ester carboxylesterase
MMIERTFDTGKILMNYAEGGATSEAPMVMLHGATVWWQDLQPLIGQLETFWHIYACDHRGHGKSGRAAGHYLINDYTYDAVAFLARVVREPAVMVGHSLGGMVGLELAAQVPGQVRALILLDPPLELRELKITDSPAYGWFSWVHETVKSSSSITEIARKCKEFMPELDDTQAMPLAEMISCVDPELVEAILKDVTLESFGWESVYRRIVCPTLLLWGEKKEVDGSAVRPEDVEYLSASVARCHQIQIKGTGHGAHRDKPAEVARNIKDFLNSIE